MIIVIPNNFVIKLWNSHSHKYQNSFFRNAIVIPVTFIMAKLLVRSIKSEIFKYKFILNKCKIRKFWPFIVLFAPFSPVTWDFRYSSCITSYGLLVGSGDMWKHDNLSNKKPILWDQSKKQTIHDDTSRNITHRYSMATEKIVFSVLRLMHCIVKRESGFFICSS